MYEHLVTRYCGLSATILTEVTERCVVSKRLGYWIFVSRDRFGFVPPLFCEQIRDLVAEDLSLFPGIKSVFDGFYTLTLE